MEAEAGWRPRSRLSHSASEIATFGRLRVNQVFEQVRKIVDASAGEIELVLLDNEH
jgi:hypothetical protein